MSKDKAEDTKVGKDGKKDDKKEEDKKDDKKVAEPVLTPRQRAIKGK